MPLGHLKLSNEADESLKLCSFYDSLFNMENDVFEGSLILERLTEIGKVDEFYEAVDSDNFSLIKKLLHEAEIDDTTIATVLKMVEEGE